MRQLPPSQEQEWLEALFDLHARAVRGYAIRRVGPDSADDVVSQVFAIAWRRRRDVGEPALPWLLRTARNVVAHEHRASARRLNLRDAIASTVSGSPSPAAEDSSQALAESILAQLSPKDAEILRLAAWEQLTPAEIAVVLDLSDSAVRTRLMRARQRAQRLLTEDSPAPRLSALPATD